MKKITVSVREMCAERITVFPESVGVLPWMLCVINSVGEATAGKMKERAEYFGVNYRKDFLNQ